MFKNIGKCSILNFSAPQVFKNIGKCSILNFSAPQVFKNIGKCSIFEFQERRKCLKHRQVFDLEFQRAASV